MTAKRLSLIGFLLALAGSLAAQSPIPIGDFRVAPPTYSVEPLVSHDGSCEIPRYPIDGDWEQGAAALFNEIHFQSGDSFVEHSDRKLTQVGRLLEAYPEFSVELRGFTDKVGSAASNRELARKRVKTVAKFLWAHHKVDEDRLEEYPLGEDSSAPNDTAEGRFHNRRVGITIRDRNGVDVTPVAPELVRSLDRLKGNIQNFQHQYGKAKFLIALLPDPADSLYSRQFDMLVSSGRRALEEEYVMDRAFLPWPGRTMKSDEPGMDSASNDALHRHLPGWAFFRNGNSTLVVLFVGETPSWGVQRNALSAALHIVEYFRRCNGSLRLPKIHFEAALLGPTFSGSSRSLGDLLQHWTKATSRRLQSAKFTVLSGTATRPENNEEITQQDRELKTFLADSGVKLDISYSSVATNDTKMLGELLSYFNHQLSIDNKEIALLTESSAYGQTFAKQGLMALPFPMHISQTRLAYSEQIRHRDQSGLSSLNGTAPSRLEVPLGNPRGKMDIPIFGTDLTPQTEEITLGSILGTVTKGKFKAVGIVATNIRDKIFLAQEVHKYAPDVRLFMFSSDVMLTHPEFAEACRGMIVASSYPLVSDNKIHFASEASRGYFEAARNLLKHLTQESIEAVEPAQQIGNLRGGDKFVLSVVGRQGFQPVKTNYEVGSVSPSRGWYLLFAFCLLFAVTISSLLVREWNQPEGRDFRVLLLRLVLLVFLFEALAVLLIPSISRTEWKILAFSTTFLAAVAFAAVLVKAFRDCKGATGSKERRAKAMKVILHYLPCIASLVVVLLIYLVFALWSGEESLNVDLLANRSVALESGVSPALVLLLLLALPALWVFMGIGRLKKMRDAAGKLHSQLLAPKESEEILALFDPTDIPQTHRRALVGALVFTIVLPTISFILFYGERGPILHSIEGFYFDLVVSGLLLLSLVLLVESGFSIFAGWLTLKRFVDTHMRRRAFVSAGSSEGGGNVAEGQESGLVRGARAVAKLLLSYLKRRMLFTTVGLLLLLVMLLNYPFEPERGLILYVAALMLLSAALCAWVSYEMSGHTCLQEITGEKGGFRTNFGPRLAVYVGLPVLSLVSARFPIVSDYVGSWLQPVFKMLL